MFKNVMLVEDDNVTLMLCKINIRKTNFAENVTYCCDGSDAINYFKNESIKPELERIIPELIFLDINMPVMNGWEFLDEFNKLYPNLKTKTDIKILSSSLDPRDLEKSKSYSIVSEFIYKPLSREILLDLLKRKA